MAKQLQLRRGTTVQHNTFTGAVGEVTIDMDKDVVVVHDGSTVGGFPSQKELVSGTNIKTVNSTTLLGSGNIAVQETLVSGTNIKTINNSTILGSGNLSIGVSGLSDTSISSPLSGQVLSYDGVNWANVTFSALPSQSGQSGKYLTTDGSNASWATLNTSLYMNDDTIPVGSSQTIPTGKQIVIDHLDVQGTLDIQGTLATVTGGYLSQTTMKTQAIAHTNGTNAMTIDSSGNVMLGSNYLTTYTGFKNYIINGKKIVNQRGLTSTDNSYNQDRWYKAGNNWYQGIEGDSNLISGQTYTLSWTGSATAGYYVGTATSATINSQSFTTIANGGNFTLTISAGQNLWIKFSSDAIGSTFNFVQLEEGSVATPFENRPYGLELSLCQRYYEIFSNITVISMPNATSAIYAADTCIISNLIYKITKRVAPTANLTLTSNGTSGWRAPYVGTPTINSCPITLCTSSSNTSWYNSATVSSGYVSAEL